MKNTTMTNRLVVIGLISEKRAYLNVPRNVALDRFLKDTGYSVADIMDAHLDEFEFEDEFRVYDAWSHNQSGYDAIRERIDG